MKNKKKVENVLNKEKKSETLCDAVFCIVNRGFVDLVMTAARKAGAAGGTVIHGRGTSDKKKEKFYGIAVSPEKEIVIIVVKRTMTDKVLLAINQEAGLDSNGQGVAFAIPVSDYHGINFANKY